MSLTHYAMLNIIELTNSGSENVASKYSKHALEPLLTTNLYHEVYLLYSKMPQVHLYEIITVIPKIIYEQIRSICSKLD